MAKMRKTDHLHNTDGGAACSETSLRAHRLAAITLHLAICQAWQTKMQQLKDLGLTDLQAENAMRTYVEMRFSDRPRPHPVLGINAKGIG